MSSFTSARSASCPVSVKCASASLFGYTAWALRHLHVIIRDVPQPKKDETQFLCAIQWLLFAYFPFRWNHEHFASSVILFVCWARLHQIYFILRRNWAFCILFRFHYIAQTAHTYTGSWRFTSAIFIISRFLHIACTVHTRPYLYAFLVCISLWSLCIYCIWYSFQFSWRRECLGNIISFNAVISVRNSIFNNTNIPSHHITAFRM